MSHARVPAAPLWTELCVPGTLFQLRCAGPDLRDPSREGVQPSAGGDLLWLRGLCPLVPYPPGVTSGHEHIPI